MMALIPVPFLWSSASYAPASNPGVVGSNVDLFSSWLPSLDVCASRMAFSMFSKVLSPPPDSLAPGLLFLESTLLMELWADDAELMFCTVIRALAPSSLFFCPCPASVGARLLGRALRRLGRGSWDAGRRNYCFVAHSFFAPLYYRG